MSKVCSFSRLGYVDINVILCDQINYACFPCESVEASPIWDNETFYCVDTTKICNHVAILISNTEESLLTEISIFGKGLYGVATTKTDKSYYSFSFFKNTTLRC